jgi:hypothetical protein
MRSFDEVTYEIFYFEFSPHFIKLDVGLKQSFYAFQININLNNMNFSFGDFSKLPSFVQSLIIGVVLLMPIFYVDIFFFHHTFFITNSIYISLLLAYSLTIGWLAVNTFISILFLTKEKRTKIVTFEEITTWSVVFSILTIIIPNMIFYFTGGQRIFGKFVAAMTGGYLSCLTTVFTIFIITNRKNKKRGVKNGQYEMELKD